jgi:ribosome-binding protein aMBF1 (putative translation factor)
MKKEPYICGDNVNSMKSKAIEFLEAHQSGDRSTFMDEAQWRRENAGWLKWSQSISLAIIDYMQDNNLTQSDLAQRLNVSRQYVSKLLSGRVNFSFKTIAELEEKLGIHCMQMA